MSDTKLDLTSHNPAEDKITDLLRLFPEIRTEGGKLDFDRLKLVLGESVDIGKERYGMNWPGKADCFKTIQVPSLGTLRPVPDESINFDTTENLIIEGDNLEVLKLLQKSYMGKVKLIYIDPPYNTGNDFIYPDNYSESLDTYLEYSRQTDEAGRKFGTNMDTEGRFHSKWMNMMYPRLYLARNLLSDDGAIFISIDHAEINNLTILSNEVFGEENLLGVITIVSNMKGRSDDKYFATSHNYLLCYKKSTYNTKGIPIPEEYWDDYPETDNNGKRYRLQGLRKRGSGAKRSDRPNMYYPIYVNPLDNTVSLEARGDFSEVVFPKLSNGEDGRWRWGIDTAKERLSELLGGRVGPEGRWDIFQVDYAEIDGNTKRIKPKTVWFGPEYSNEAGNLQVKKLLGSKIFDTCKPVKLISDCIEMSTDEDDIILDFFAGSGTTAQAVLDLNKQDGGNRKFILVQLPEPTGREDYPTISEITKERVRRVIKKLNESENGTLGLDGAALQDRGFKVFKLDQSNFTTWEANRPTDAASLNKQLELHVDHIREKRTQEDILYEILLKSGFPLETKLEKITLENKTVYSVAEGGLLVCLEEGLTFELIRALAEKTPQRVVCLDAGFAKNDQLKTNAVLTFKSKNIVFRTV